jgi:hypothetical protein
MACWITFFADGARRNSSLWVLYSQEVWVCAAFEVLARTRSPSGHGWSSALRWKDDDGRMHRSVVVDADLQRNFVRVCGGRQSARPDHDNALGLIQCLCADHHRTTNLLASRGNVYSPLIARRMPIAAAIRPRPSCFPPPRWSRSSPTSLRRAGILDWRLFASTRRGGQPTRDLAGVAKCLPPGTVVDKDLHPSENST